MTEETRTNEAGNGQEYAASVKRDKAAKSAKKAEKARKAAARSDQEKRHDGANSTEKATHYVHLANGDVERVNEKDLPVASGTNATMGHYEKNGHSYLVIGVYPVEDAVTERNEK